MQLLVGSYWKLKGCKLFLAASLVWCLGPLLAHLRRLSLAAFLAAMPWPIWKNTPGLNYQGRCGPGRIS